MPKIIDLPELEDLDGTELVVLEKDNTTGRGRLREYLDAAGLNRVIGTDGEQVAIGDTLGFTGLTIGGDRTEFGGAAHEATEGGAAIGDALGFNLLALDPNGIGLGPVTIVPVQGDWSAITDDLGFVQLSLGGEPQTEIDTIPLWRGPLAGVAGVPIYLQVPALLADRAQADRIHCSFGSGYAGFAETSSSQIRIDPYYLDDSAEIVIRARDSKLRTRISFPVAIAPSPPPAASAAARILFIMDSIGQFQGAHILDASLQGLGYGPDFIGTVRGAADAGAEGISDAADGPLGEARPGWQTGTFTGRYVAPYRIAADGTLVTDWSPGAGVADTAAALAAYQALSAIEKRYINVFLRDAAGGDDPALVQNGTVLDFARYQTFFGLQAPDIVIYGAGTNNAYFLDDRDLRANIRADDMLMHQRMRVAWPTAKIIRFCPGAASDRDVAWQAGYCEFLRGMMMAHRDIADPRYIMAPVWAMEPTEIGYPMAGATIDPITGAQTGLLSDPIHPIGPNRTALYRALAGYAAAAIAGVI